MIDRYFFRRVLIAFSWAAPAIRVVRRVAPTCSLLSLLCSSLSSNCWAQAGMGGQAGPEIAPPPLAAQRANPFDIPSREYSAISLAGWLLYPSVSVGAVFDSNVNQTGTNRVASAGLRVVPSLLAQANDGIHRTDFYGTFDARAYSDGEPFNANSVAARTGLAHTWEATAALVFTFQGDYTRQRDLFSTFGIDRGVPSLNTTGVGLSPTANAPSYNQFAGSASVQKTFDRTFASLTASVVDMVFDHTTAGSPSPDGIVYTTTGRAGWWFMPFLYAYAEPSVDERRYTTTALNSHGYRMVSGIGSDQIGLFRGEVYGGYQAEQYDAAALGTAGSTTFGGRWYYYPTPALTLRVSLDRSLGISLVPTSPTSPFGSATRVTTALLQANYAIALEWSANARFGYVRTEYVGSTQLDDALMAGCTITYSIWQNLGLTLDYQFLQVSSTGPLQNFTRSMIMLGASYKN
jgi:hypothetical protein